MHKVVGMVLAMTLSACVGREQVAVSQPPDAPPLAGARPLLGQPVLPSFYAAEAMSVQLEDPREILFDAAGEPHVLEGMPARLSRVLADGTLAPIARGGGNGAWTGAARMGDIFYVAEQGGELGGRILAVDLKGAVTPVRADLPAGVTGKLAAGPDGALYLAMGTRVGETGASGEGSNIPCQDLRLLDGRELAGAVPCTGAVLRVAPDGSEISVHSWGFANPVDMAFTPAGRLLVADDLPPQVAGDVIWAAVPGVWYGWPDYLGQTASAEPQLASLPNPPPPPLAELAGQVAGLAMAGDAFGGPSQMFVALGEAGQVAFAGMDSPTFVPFADNLVRPSALAFEPSGRALYVADAETGTLWRIVEFPG